MKGKQRILITGCNGLVGRSLTDDLAGDHELVLWDKHQPEFKNAFRARSVDLTSYEAVRRAMEPVDAVIHLAIASYREIMQGGSFSGAIDPSAAQRFDQQTLRVNNEGAFHVFEAAKEVGVGRFLYMSSLTINNGGRESGTLDVSQEPRPRDLYACTKLFGETLGRLYSADGEMRVCCLRLGQPFPIKEYPDVMAKPAHPLDRAVLVHYDDIREAVRCVLQAELPVFSLYNLVSAQAAERFPEHEITADPIGFRPTRRITSDGNIEPARD